jgi:hypothetical protein
MSFGGVPLTPQEKLGAIMEEMGYDQDEAAHFLVDAGEIDSTEHADLLTPEERERVYG